MPLKNIQRGYPEVSYEHQLVADWLDGPEGCGVGFNCDEDGNFDVDYLNQLSEAALENLADMYSSLMGPIRLVTYTSRYYVPGDGECECGRTVWLYNAPTIGCDCGRLYNGSGQELNSNYRVWGEETGESFYSPWDF